MCIYSYNVTTGGGSCISRVQVVACRAPVCNSATVQLPLANGSCEGAALDPAALYSGGAGVSVSPPLPDFFPPGDTSYIVGGESGFCVLTVSVKPCQLPVCNSLYIKLPQNVSGSAGCAGARVNESLLYSGAEASVSPPLVRTVPPGRHYYTVSNPSGECEASLRVAPCNITCNSTTIQLPQGDGGCDAAVLQGSSMYNSQGMDVLIRPGGEVPNTFTPGNSSYEVSDMFGQKCNVTINVLPCPACRRLQVKVISSRKTSGLDTWRVARATLQVTDGTGGRLKGITVDAAWTHVPVRGSQPAFPRKAVRGVTSGSPRSLGQVSFSAPKAVPYGGALTLTVLFARDTRTSGCDFWRQGSDLATNFTCGSRGC